MDAKGVANKAEELIDSLSFYVKPYLPATARFLLVVTFLEDSMRILCVTLPFERVLGRV